MWVKTERCGKPVLIVGGQCHGEPMFPLDDEGRPGAIWVCGVCGLDVTWTMLDTIP